jgi:hypothetical protein
MGYKSNRVYYENDSFIVLVQTKSFLLRKVFAATATKSTNHSCSDCCTKVILLAVETPTRGNHQSPTWRVEVDNSALVDVVESSDPYA